YTHPFTAPNLTQCGYVDLRGYEHPFTAPNLTQCGYVDLRGYEHPITAPNLTQCGNVDLVDYTHPFTAPNLTQCGNVFTDTDRVISLGGVDYETTSIDCFAMLGVKWHTVEGVEVSKAKYLKLPEQKDCYVARIGEHAAHGETLKQAIEDVRFKLLDCADKDEIAAEIKKAGIVTLNQWRALTGACREGTANKLGLTVDTLPESMPVADVLKHSAGTSFGDTFKGYL